MEFWAAGEIAGFKKSKEKYGDLSNMTGGFPLKICGLEFSGPEALYQALKYPDSIEAQRAIADAKSGMEAKRVAYREEYRKYLRCDWNDVRISAMRMTLMLKLHQHFLSFGLALQETIPLPIVEISDRDDFWGAKPVYGGYYGENALGRLLMALAEYLPTFSKADETHEIAKHYLAGDDLSDFKLNGRFLREKVSEKHG